MLRRNVTKEAWKNLGVRRFYSRMLPGAKSPDAGQAVRANPDRNPFLGAFVRLIVFGLVALAGGIALFLGPGLPHRMRARSVVVN